MTIKKPRWIYGDLFRSGTDPDDGIFAISYWDDESGWMNENVQPRTVGQFTSLRDKNGRDIFEGDLLKVGDEKTLIEVRFVRGVFAFLWNGDLEDEFPCNAPTQEWAEVIGNIHDNPKLLRKRHEKCRY